MSDSGIPSSTESPALSQGQAVPLPGGVPKLGTRLEVARQFPDWDLLPPSTIIAFR